ncbi:MAG: AMP-dependent synthetase, partial [Moorea sp. SIO2I5]|nr:AMP-dependent synthetase [Moorena sp. SIO2I5]
TMRVVEQLGAIDPTLCAFVVVHNILGIRPLLNYGSKQLKKELLPLLATGRELAAFAITEPGAGSNPRALSARAIPHGQGWRLQGTKIWSGSAAWAGAINVFVQQLDVKGKSRGISSFLLRRDTKGLRQGPEALTMGMRGMVQNTVFLDDVPVTDENLLGKPGQGMGVAQDAMMYGRLSVAAASVGGMKHCAQLMLRYSSRRGVFTGRLLDNPVTLTRLNGLIAAITAVETLVTRIARILDRGGSVPVEAYTACKTSGPELLWQAADNLVQLLGGRGYIETNIAPQILRDARVLRIFEGPTETLNMFLGSRVINDSEELHHFICQGLGAEAVSVRLKEAAGQIRARLTSSPAPFAHQGAANNWACFLAGELATWAILQAAVAGVDESAQSESCRRAVTWTRLNFDQKLAQALSLSPNESVVDNADVTAQLIGNYTETIGEIEQTLAGEDYELDKLLQLHDSQMGKDINIQFDKEQTPIHHSLAVSFHNSQSIENWMRLWLIKNLKIASKSIDSGKSFADYGLDSLTAVELATDLSEWLGRELEPTIAWNYSSIKSLAEYLAEGTSTANAEVVKAEISEDISDEVKKLSEEEVKTSIKDELAEIESFLI